MLFFFFLKFILFIVSLNTQLASIYRYMPLKILILLHYQLKNLKSYKSNPLVCCVTRNIIREGFLRKWHPKQDLKDKEKLAIGKVEGWVFQWEQHTVSCVLVCVTSKEGQCGEWWQKTWTEQNETGEKLKPDYNSL